MNDMIPFEYNGNRVRVIRDETGDPWFVSKDACRVIGHTNHKVAVRSLENDERGVRKVYPPERPEGVDVNVVSESGLYTLIIRSNKPEAKRFRRWITHDVLPSIRRNGCYHVEESAEPPELVLNDYPGLKPTLRLRLMELSYRLSNMDNAGKRRFLSDYDRLCSALAPKDAPPEKPREFDRFVRERCVMANDALVGATALYQAYREYCNERDIPMPSQQAFGSTAGARFRRIKSHGYVNYRGVRLRAD